MIHVNADPPSWHCHHEADRVTSKSRFRACDRESLETALENASTMIALRNKIEQVSGMLFEHAKPYRRAKKESG